MYPVVGPGTKSHFLRRSGPYRLANLDRKQRREVGAKVREIAVSIRVFREQQLYGRNERLRLGIAIAMHVPAVLNEPVFKGITIQGPIQDAG